MSYIIAIVVGYLFGCIQTSYILGKILLRKDIRDHGSGNAGASNATMVFGRKAGIFTGAIDIFKAVASVTLIRVLFEAEVDPSFLQTLLYLNGLMVIVGHNFPFYMHFRGGKGTSSLIGFLLALDLSLGLIGGLTIVVFTLISDYIALGTMALLAVFVGYTIVFIPRPSLVTIALLIAAMSVYKHIPNLIKIRDRQETSVRRTLFGKKEE